MRGAAIAVGVVLLIVVAYCVALLVSALLAGQERPFADLDALASIALLVPALLGLALVQSLVWPRGHRRRPLLVGLLIAVVLIVVLAVMAVLVVL